MGRRWLLKMGREMHGRERINNGRQQERTTEGRGRGVWCVSVCVCECVLEREKAR